jgi:hypothetical protein
MSGYSFLKSAEEIEKEGFNFWRFLQKSEKCEADERAGREPIGFWKGLEEKERVVASKHKTS